MDGTGTPVFQASAGAFMLVRSERQVWGGVIESGKTPLDPLRSVTHSPQTCHPISQRKVSRGLTRSPSATLSTWVQVMVWSKSPKLRSFYTVRMSKKKRDKQLLASVSCRHRMALSVPSQR